MLPYFYVPPTIDKDLRNFTRMRCTSAHPLIDMHTRCVGCMMIALFAFESLRFQSITVRARRGARYTTISQRVICYADGCVRAGKCDCVLFNVRSPIGCRWAPNARPLFVLGRRRRRCCGPPNMRTTRRHHIRNGVTIDLQSGILCTYSRHV